MLFYLLKSTNEPQLLRERWSMWGMEKWVHVLNPLQNYNNIPIYSYCYWSKQTKSWKSNYKSNKQKLTLLYICNSIWPIARIINKRIRMHSVEHFDFFDEYYLYNYLEHAAIPVYVLIIYWSKYYVTRCIWPWAHNSTRCIHSCMGGAHYSYNNNLISIIIITFSVRSYNVMMTYQQAI